MMMGGGGSRYPFTLSQWQELELQSLVFRYMASGLPVPSDLILCIRRRLFIDPQTLPFLPNPPAIGWGAYQMDYSGARTAMAAEPGRCRRTDGKKWRCSKEAYPDSKYCERHMHRGKSRSRKSVELSLATTSLVSSHCSSNFPQSLSRRSTHEYPFLLESSRRSGREIFMQSTDHSPAKLEEEQPRPFHCFLDEKPPKNDEDPWKTQRGKSWHANDCFPVLQWYLHMAPNI